MPLAIGIGNADVTSALVAVERDTGQPEAMITYVLSESRDVPIAALAAKLTALEGRNAFVTSARSGTHCGGYDRVWCCSCRVVVCVTCFSCYVSMKRVERCASCYRYRQRRCHFSASRSRA